MSDYAFHTKYEIAEKTGIEISSVASRIRDLRLEKFGGHKIVRMRVSRGVFAYRLEAPRGGQGVLF